MTRCAIDYVLYFLCPRRPIASSGSKHAVLKTQPYADLVATNLMFGVFVRSGPSGGRDPAMKSRCRYLRGFALPSLTSRRSRAEPAGQPCSLRTRILRAFNGRSSKEVACLTRSRRTIGFHSGGAGSSSTSGSAGCCSHQPASRAEGRPS
jgi:hypothetical protein